MSEDEEIDLAMSKEVLYRFASRLIKVQEVRRDERGFSRQQKADRRMVRRGETAGPLTLFIRMNPARVAKEHDKSRTLQEEGMIGPALKNARDADRCFYGGFKGAGEVRLPYGSRGEQSLMEHLAPDVRER